MSWSAPDNRLSREILQSSIMFLLISLSSLVTSDDVSKSGVALVHLLEHRVRICQAKRTMMIFSLHPSHSGKLQSHACATPLMFFSIDRKRALSQWHSGFNESLVTSSGIWLQQRKRIFQLPSLLFFSIEPYILYNVNTVRLS